MTSRGGGFRAAALGALVFLLLGLVSNFAAAHAIGLSNGEYRVRGNTIEATFAFARAEVLALSPEIDKNHDGALAEDEVSAAYPILERDVVVAVTLRGEKGPCKGHLVSAKLTEQDGVALVASYTCEGTRPRTLVFSVLEGLPKGHRHLCRQILEGAPPRDDILFGGHVTFELTAEGAPPKESKGPSSFFAFFALGLEHILTGYDHLVFLVGLVLVRGKLRSYLAVVTAFTLAHSITLGLSVMDIVHPPGRFVEPAIALSIAYVGIENFIVKDAAKRWRITFPFGLLHGFGFAGALREIDLPRPRIPSALVAFNLGVEAGQLAVLVVAIPLVLWVTKRHTRAHVTRGLSGCVVLAGLVWFCVRVV